MSRRWLFAALFGIALIGCGLSVVGLDSESAPDAGLRTQTPDAASDVMLPKADAAPAPRPDAAGPPPDAGADTGTDAGAAATFFCPATGGAVTACSACAGNPLECTLCGGPTPRTFCTTGRICNESQALSNWCPCDGSNQPARCPSPRQTCYRLGGSGICLTCGEQNETDGYACQDGTTCSRDTYTCH